MINPGQKTLYHTVHRPWDTAEVRLYIRLRPSLWDRLDQHLVVELESSLPDPGQIIPWQIRLEFAW